jgi:uncharacterized membrane protein affecting hemolysin expression
MTAALLLSAVAGVLLWLFFAAYRRGRRHERMRWEADWKRETAERRNSQL